MEEEHFFTGYCRQIDASRMVTAVTENGCLTETDCCYGRCVYQQECTIGKELRKLETAE